MSKPSRKKTRTVEVQIMFEPNRLEQHSLHKAYSCLVPVLKRRLLPQTTAIEHPLKRWHPSEKGICHE